MSAEFTKPSDSAMRLLAALLSRGKCPPEWADQLVVSSMSDGGMGSLSLQLAGHERQGVAFGRPAAELEFDDEDGVKVIATLNLGEDGLPLELDVWKTDFSPLKRIPDPLPNP